METHADHTARQGRGSRRRLGFALGAGGGAAAVAAAVVAGVALGGAGTVVNAVAPPEIAPAVQPASAADLLNGAALQIEENPVVIPEGSYLKAEAHWSMLNTVKPGEVYWEGGFSRTRTGAVGAAMVDLQWDVFVPSTGTGDRITSIIPKHPTQVYGDQQAVADAWNGGDLSSVGDFAAVSAAPPAASVTAMTEEGRQYEAEHDDKSKLPTDPQQFLDATGKSAADLLKDSQMPDFATAPVEYRATVLRAIALSPDLQIESQDGDVAVITLTGPDSTMKATLDTAKAQILQVDSFVSRYTATDAVSTDENPNPAESVVEVGSAPFLGADVPDERYSLTTEIVTEAPTPNE